MFCLPSRLPKSSGVQSTSGHFCQHAVTNEDPWMRCDKFRCGTPPTCSSSATVRTSSRSCSVGHECGAHQRLSTRINLLSTSLTWLDDPHAGTAGVVRHAAHGSEAVSCPKCIFTTTGAGTRFVDREPKYRHCEAKSGSVSAWGLIGPVYCQTDPNFHQQRLPVQYQEPFHPGRGWIYCQMEQILLQS